MNLLLQRSGEPLAGIRRLASRAALAAALPGAMLLAALALLTLSDDRAGASETLFLALWSVAVFTPLALLETASRPGHAALGILATLLVATVSRSGGLRPVVVAALLALAVVIVAVVTFSRRPRLDLRSAAALSLAAVFVLHGHRLFLEGLNFTTFGLLALLPAVAAAAASRLAAAGRPGAALAVAFALVSAPQLAREPWWVVLAWVAAAIAATWGVPPLAHAGRSTLVIFFTMTLLAGGFPWLRAAPVAALAGSIPRFTRSVAETPIAERAVVLTASAPRFQATLSGAPVRAVVLDSYLTHGVDLACGRALASVELDDEPGEGAPMSARGRWSATLVVGRDSAEWAAGRPDVAARLACVAPAPWISWIPGAGQFLGQTTRARLALPSATSARILRIERSPDLPLETALALFFVATER